ERAAVERLVDDVGLDGHQRRRLALPQPEVRRAELHTEAAAPAVEVLLRDVRVLGPELIHVRGLVGLGLDLAVGALLLDLHLDAVGTDLHLQRLALRDAALARDVLHLALEALEEVVVEEALPRDVEPLLLHPLEQLVEAILEVLTAARERPRPEAGRLRQSRIRVLL